MIKAVFFDFYNTLARFWPPLDELQYIACGEIGLNISKEQINQGYFEADRYFNLENERCALALRTDEDRLRFFAHYEQIILDCAGLSVSLDLARQIWEITTTIPRDIILFDDVIPALTVLHSRGYLLGLISNLRLNLSELSRQLKLSHLVNFCITSTEVGVEKPHPAIFLSALERAKKNADETIHVGDQYKSDILGARALGIHPILIDRGGWHPNIIDCPKITSLSELDTLIAASKFLF